jgi:hypothetical protein
MANITISQLPQATTLTGTELVPIVQNGVTVQTTANLLAQANTLTQQFLTWGNGSGLANSRFLAGNNGIGLTVSGTQVTVALNGVSSTLESASNGIMAKIGGTMTPRTISVSGNGLIAAFGNGQLGNPTISLSPFMQTISATTGIGLLGFNSNSGAAYSVTITGVVNQTAVANGNAFSGSSPTIGIADNPIIPGNAAITIPSGTTAQRGGTAGSIRFNTDSSTYEGYNGSIWSSLASGGSVTSITAGSGLTGGTITTTGTIAVDTTVVATSSNSLTLTNKSISGAANTVTNLPNSALTNNTITINGNTVSLGGSVTIGTGGTSQSLTFGSGVTGGVYTSFNGSTAVTVSVDPTVTATLTGTQTLTNKTISGASNTITGLQNTALAYPYFTINGTQFQLGSTISIAPATQSTLTLGSGLTGSSYNGSAAVTTTVDNTVVAFLTASQNIINKNIDASNIGSSTPGTGAFTTLSATGQITSTVATGTAPLSVASTTNVPNLNASFLNGATFAAPGSIGSGTANSGAFTTLSASTITATTSVTVGGNLVISRGAGTNSSIAIGQGNPLGANTGSDGNIAIGYGALSLSTNSRNSTMVGAFAGRGLTGSGGGFNEGFGINSVGGFYSTATSNALYNVGIGSGALYKILGNANTALGQGAGSNITTGNYNTIIGQYDGNAAPISATGSNYIVLSDGQGNIRGYFDNSGNFVVNGTSTSGATGTTYANQYVSNVATGTAPFIIASTTQVANLNVAQAGKVTNALTAGSGISFSSGTTYDGSVAITISTTSSFNPASPGPIGSTTASSGAFTTLSASSTVSGTGFSTYLASPPAIGGTAAAAGSFTTLSASSTVSGVGFSTYLASPPAIGGTTAAAGTFTTVTASSGVFTTLSASSTVSGVGFSTYLASPPAIGGTTAAAGTFTTLTASAAIRGFYVASITSITTASTITPSITIGQYEVSALASSATIAAPAAGVDSQKLLIRIKDNGTAQTLTWTTSSGGYRALGPTLPTTTVVGKPVYIGCVYNAQDTYWDVLAVSA